MKHKLIMENWKRYLNEVHEAEVAGTKAFAAEGKEKVCVFAYKIKKNGANLQEFSVGIFMGFHFVWKKGLEKTDKRLAKAQNVQDLDAFCKGWSHPWGMSL
tara:strand:- start:10370 stop:10672 length:303 start_codon:yes stop_codon:yes gene_type:complete